MFPQIYKLVFSFFFMSIKLFGKGGSFNTSLSSLFPKNKKGNILIIVLILIGFAIFGGYISIASIGDFETVYKQNWGHICCVQEDDYDTFSDWADNSPSFTCDQYTNECRITVNQETTDVKVLYSKNLVLSYTVDGLSKTATSGQSFTIPHGSTVKFGFRSQYFRYSAQWKNYFIEGEEDGKIFSQESCILNSALKQRVLNDGLNELQKTGANRCQNYMMDFIQVATKTYTWKGKNVMCQARQVFEIKPMTFKDGQTRKIQGNSLGAVECCPAEPNCNEQTFTFVENNVRECELNSQCANGGDPVAVTGTSYVKYQCVNGDCQKSQEKAVECTNNAVCIQKFGVNSVCDLSPANWGKCKDNSQFIGYCGDGLCESIIGETQTSCPADCGERVRGWSIPWYYWVIITILVIVLYRPVIRPLLKMIPYIGWIFP